MSTPLEEVFRRSRISVYSSTWTSSGEDSLTRKCSVGPCGKQPMRMRGSVRIFVKRMMWVTPYGPAILI